MLLLTMRRHSDMIINRLLKVVMLVVDWKQNWLIITTESVCGSEYVDVVSLCTGAQKCLMAA